MPWKLESYSAVKDSGLQKINSMTLGVTYSKDSNLSGLYWGSSIYGNYHTRVYAGFGVGEQGLGCRIWGSCDLGFLFVWPNLWSLGGFLELYGSEYSGYPRRD